LPPPRLARQTISAWRAISFGKAILATLGDGRGFHAHMNSRGIEASVAEAVVNKVQ
jgi:ABC-type transporter Mla maintaining outer membrane lipid asymmetry permease subunit MlaE